MADTITIRGAREHNLKDIDLELPRDKLSVITGLSGSGKSSLVFDTIYAEGQRRYVESLSSYARQFLGIMEKPDVDQIDGLSPAISIDQKSAPRNPRSTVATVTEIYDYLRLLFARIGIPHCPICGKRVSKQSTSQIIEAVMKLPAKRRILVLAPIVNDKKGEFKHIPAEMKRSGFMRVRVDDIVYDGDEFPTLDKQKKHTIEIVVDRLSVAKDNRSRLSESIEQALDLADGVLKVLDVDKSQEHIFSEQFTCVDHPNAPIAEMAPRSFSFNSPHGACPHCTGLGMTLEIDPELVIASPRLSVAEGVIRPWSRGKYDSWYMRRLAGVADALGFGLDTPWQNLSKDHQQAILYGVKNKDLKVRWTSTSSVESRSGYFLTDYEGVIPNLERRYRETDSDYTKNEISKYMRERTCPVCLGARLKPEVLAVTITNKSIMDVAQLSISKADDFFKGLKLSERENLIAKQIFKEIKSRLKFLIDVGLNYLTLERSANTLSGGEAQRIRLATQIGSGLMGVLYVLDEPSIGLHQRDNRRLIDTLEKLRDLGNTVIVVEHDEETIRSADEVVDIGPAAGEHGGAVVVKGSPSQIAKHPKSITGKFLSGKAKIPVPTQRRNGNGQVLKIKGAPLIFSTWPLPLRL